MSPVRLKLSLRNVDSLDNGMPVTIEFVQRNVIIGRAPSADWCLPDPRAHISSRHCEISYTPAGYVLADRSTNGTYLNGAKERLAKPRLIESGDWFAIGHYEIVAMLEGGAEPLPVPAPAPGWDGWEAPPPPAPSGPPGWDVPPPAPPAWPAPSPGGWDPPPPTAEPAWVPPPSPASPWDAPAPVPDPSSPWSSATPSGVPPPTAEDAWGKLADSYVVDWRRGGFVPDPVHTPAHEAVFAPPPVTPPPAPAPAPAAPAAAAPTAAASDAATLRFLEAAGLEPAQFRGRESEILTVAGGLLRRLVAGMVVMLEARARAKSQMGARTTVFSRDGNNPLKFARSPESALLQLLGGPVDGYMPADHAVEDGFRDLQTHQIATLKAMQGALRATLDRFSPDAVRKRAEANGKVGGLLPGSREAALWQAYQREFSGVAQGSDEAFMDVFAREFRRAYEALSTPPR